MSSSCPSVCVCLSVRESRKFANTTLYKPLGQFHQICSFGTLGDEYKLIRFLDQKVRGQGHDHVD